MLNNMGCNEHATSSLAPSKVFGIFELVELILGYVGTKDVFRARRIDIFTKQTIDTSRPLQTKLLFHQDAQVERKSWSLNLRRRIIERNPFPFPEPRAQLTPRIELGYRYIFNPILLEVMMPFMPDPVQVDVRLPFLSVILTPAAQSPVDESLHSSFNYCYNMLLTQPPMLNADVTFYIRPAKGKASSSSDRRYRISRSSGVRYKDVMKELHKHSISNSWDEVTAMDIRAVEEDAALPGQSQLGIFVSTEEADMVRRGEWYKAKPKERCSCHRG